MGDYFTIENGESLFLDEYGDVSVNAAEGGHTVVALHGLGGGGYFFAGSGAHPISWTLFDRIRLRIDLG